MTGRQVGGPGTSPERRCLEGQAAQGSCLVSSAPDAPGPSVIPGGSSLTGCRDALEVPTGAPW